MRPAADSTSGGRRYHLPQVIGLGLLLIGVAAFGSQQQAGSPRDAYPGFAQTSDNAIRDDTIALWEAYNREVVVADCMEVAGFDYRPAAAYPDEATITVAHALGVSADVQGAESPFEWNASFEASLASEDRERYSQALYGESSEDMAAAAESEQVPDGRGADFGRGGCKGIGDASAPSIWDLPRSVGAELEAATASIAAAPDLVAESEEEYRACAAKTAAVDVSSPMDLDAALAADEELGSKAAEIRVSCDAIWADRYNAARATAFADVRDRHAAEFTEVADRYAGVLDTIRGDSDFMDYLASSATLAMSAADLHLDE